MTSVKPGRDPALGGATRTAGAILQGVLYVGYPFAVYAAFTRLETRAVGLLLLAAFGVTFAFRARRAAAEIGALVRQHLGIALLIAVAVISDSRFYLLILPSLLSLYFLWTFGSSLLRGPPMIERFARIVEDDLPDFTLPYCRKVTITWCGFFALNALCVGVLALTAPLGWWAVYTGGIFYVALGLLATTEFCLRKVWFRYYNDSLLDQIIARLFPAERTQRGRRSLSYVADRSAGAAR